MFEFINEYSSLVNALAAVAVFAATVVLAIYTRQLAKRTSEPFVVFYLKSSESSAHAMNQVLVNTGTATAFDIIATMSPALPHPIDGPNPDNNDRELSLLPPGQSLAFVGAMGKDIAETEFEVVVSWARKPNGRRCKPLKYKITARDGFAAGFQVKGLHQVADALEKIANRK